MENPIDYVQIGLQVIGTAAVIAAALPPFKSPALEFVRRIICALGANIGHAKNAK